MARLSDYINQKIPSDFRVSDQQQVGIGAFTADVRVKENVKMESSAPTTILEDGSFANDHIINNPVVLEISGEVSDVKLRESAFRALFRSFNSEIGVITKYAPTATNAQINKIQTLVSNLSDQVDRVDDIIGDAEQLYGLIGNKTPEKGSTQKFFDYIEAVRQAKQPIAIQMPYKLYENMVITSVSIRTDNQYEPLGYSITAQQIRFAQVKFVGIERFKQNPASGLNGQADEATNKGVNDGRQPDPNSSFASKISDAIGGLF